MKRLIFTIVVHFALTACALAQSTSIRCTYLLQEWKKNDLSGTPGCPSGDSGLGKPWLSITYSFPAPKKVNQSVISEVVEDSCIGGPFITNGQLTYTQNHAVVTYKNRYGNMERRAINRESLKDDNGAQCQLILVQAGKRRF